MYHIGVFLRVALGLFVGLIALFAFSLVPWILAYEQFAFFGGGGLTILFGLTAGSLLGWLTYKLIVGAFHGEQRSAS